jgi:hypothetical protein
MPNLSVLKYGIIFWGGVQKDFKTLFKLQKKCLKVIKGEKIEYHRGICFVN